LTAPDLGARRARPAARGLTPAGSDPLQTGTLVLSPHFDDAALSIGGALEAGAFPDPVCIYSVFGVSNYTRNRFHAGWRRVTSLRRREEKRYAAALGAICAFAEFQEAALRIGSDFPSLFRCRGNAYPLKPARFDRAMRDIVLEYRPRLLLCALGIGDHWDHLLVYRAVRKMRLGLRLPVLFYEDLPYAERLGPHSVERTVALLGPRFHSITIPIDLDAKCAGLTCYASQLGNDDTHRVRKYAWDLAKRTGAKGPSERLWTSTPAIIAL
jgi:LmbE family N-acetylglucosaminyl deacetylase